MNDRVMPPARPIRSTIPALRPINRRRFLALVGGAVGTASLAACGGLLDAPATAPIATAARAVASPPPVSCSTRQPELLVVEAGDYRFSGRGSIPAGVTTIQLRNRGGENHEMFLVRLKPDFGLVDYLAALRMEDPATGEMATDIGGPAAIKPGGTSEVTLDLAPGNYVLGCGIPNAEGKPHFALGMVMALLVTPPTAPAIPLPEGAGSFTINDDGVTLPQLITGTFRYRVTNTGQKALGFTLLRLLPGKTLDDARAAFDGPPMGGFPFEGAGGITSLAPGGTALMTLDLTPGDYVYFHDQPGPDIKMFTIR